MLWDRFYQLCEENNTKPNAVAKMIGVSSATCTKWKNGAVPNGETLLKLANHLNVSVDYLLGRVREPNGYLKVTYPVETPPGELKTDNIENNTEKQDEMTEELLKAFKSMSFPDKMDIMNAVLAKSKKEA